MSLSNFVLRPIAVNDVFDIASSYSTSDGQTLQGLCRVIHIEASSRPSNAYVYIVLLEIDRPLPISISRPEFEQQILTGAFKASTFPLPVWMTVGEEDIGEKALAIRDGRWEIIKTLVEQPSTTGVLLSEFRGRLIKSRIEAIAVQGKTTAPTKANIYIYLYAYWKYGQVKNALLPKFANCGAPGVQREPGEAKRGAPNKMVRLGHNVAAHGVNVDHRHRQNFAFAHKTFRVGCKLSVADTYRRMQSSCYSVSSELNGFVHHVPIASDLYPTLGQFRDWVIAHETDYAVRRDSVGEMMFEQKHRQRSGRVTDVVSFPTEVFEIDASIANIWLVSRFNRQQLIGKPVVYFVVDRFSSMITGLHVALEGPSWNAARLALYWTMSDKVDYCKNYGVDIQPEDWPSREAPRMFVSDSGEMLSKAAKDSLQNNLKINSQYNAFGRPDRKPLVESRFRFVQGNTEWLAGAYRGRAQKWREDTGRDPRFDAVLTLHEFTGILIREVLDHNNNQNVNHLLDYQMRKYGVKPYRRDIYLWGLENVIGDGNGRVVKDNQRLYQALLPYKDVKVSDKGIKLNKTYYVPCKSDHYELLSLARKKSIDARAYYDTNSPRRIWVKLAGKDHFEQWEWPDHEIRRWQDSRYEEIEDALETQHLNDTENLTAERANTEMKHQLSQAVEDQAKKLKKLSATPASKKAKLGGVKEARTTEKLVERLVITSKTIAPKEKLVSKKANVIDMRLAKIARREKTLKRMVAHKKD
jgi:hypothetical protein